MSDDLIRRSDVYKAVDDWLEGKVSNLNIKDIPSADRPQGEWIPCSERLPEEKEVVAVVIKQWDTSEIKKGITYRVDHNLWVGFGRHNEACVWWLPLPSWKGADDEID